MVRMAGALFALAVTSIVGSGGCVTAHSADNTLPVCPDFPDPNSIDISEVLKDPRVKGALKSVDNMLGKAAADIPSGMVATVVLGQTTAFTKGYGTRDITDPNAGPPRGTDLVRIASITKVIAFLHKC